MEYTLWLKTFNLEDNEENKTLYENRNDMGFWFDDYQVAKENGALSENQIRAVEMYNSPRARVHDIANNSCLFVFETKKDLATISDIVWNNNIVGENFMEKVNQIKQMLDNKNVNYLFVELEKGELVRTHTRILLK